MDRVVLALVAVFVLFDSFSAFAEPGQRELYGFVVATCALIAFASLKFRPLAARASKMLVLWLAVTFAYALPVLAQKHLYYDYVVGDWASMMFPAVLFMLGNQFPRLFASEQSHRTLVACFIVAAVVAFAVGEYALGEKRFEAPRVFAIVATWVWLMSARSPLELLTSLLSVAGLLVLGFRSGYRTTVVIWAFAGALLFLLRKVTAVRAMPLVAIIAAVGFAYSADLFESRALQQAVEESRFRGLFRGEVDGSLRIRLNEARDVIDTAREQWAPIQFAYGYGHGATYVPGVSYIERNVTADGVVHHIHIGPVLTLYRYGVIGVLLLVALWVSVARELLRIRSLGQLSHLERPRLILAVSMLLYLIDFMVRNSLADPGFSYALAGFLVLRQRSAAHASRRDTLDWRRDR